MMFNHFILTRYNYGLYSGNYFGNIGIPDRDKWMTDRYIRFSDICVPSVKAQKNQNFTWLILMDWKTPEHYAEQIKAIIPENALIINEWFWDYLRKQKLNKWLITSRLDNDDYIYPEYTSEIQRHFRKKPEVIDVGSTITYEATGKKINSQYNGNRKAASMFVSLAEANNGHIKTVAYTQHWMLPKFHRLRRIEKVLADHIIHDQNASHYKK